MNYEETIKQIKALVKAEKFQPALELTLVLRQEYPRDLKSHNLLNKIKVQFKKQELQARENFIKNGLKTIQKIRKAADFKRAIQACQELLETDPYNSQAKRLLAKSKIDFIEQKLQSPLKTQLEQQHQYDKLYLFYQKLRAVFPHYHKLNKLVHIAEKKAMEQDFERKKEFTKTSLAKLNDWYNQEKYEAVIKGSKELMAFTHYGSSELKKLLRKTIKANQAEIEQDTLAFMFKQEPILRAAYESGQDKMIKV